jgi:hypothetical protein
MDMSEVAQCMLENCSSHADIIVELKGQQLLLCRTHFKSLVARLSRVAERGGLASLSRIKVVKAGDGKVRVLVKRSRSKRRKGGGERKSSRRGRKRGERRKRAHPEKGK